MRSTRRRPAFVLQCLLERRPAGADGSAALSRRLRRDRRGGAGAEHHASAAGVRVESAPGLLNPSGYIPARKIPAIATAVVEACDARDGVKDGVVDNPTTCGFKAASLRCSGAESDSCLTAPQVAALRNLRRSADLERPEVYPGFPPGGELGPGGWALWITGETPGTSLQSLFSAQGAPNLVHQDAAYTVKSFDVDRAASLLDGAVARLVDADNPDLTAFKRRGGKLIIYHGWSDPALSASATIDYYASVSHRMGAKRSATSRACTWCPACNTATAGRARPSSARGTSRGPTRARASRRRSSDGWRTAWAGARIVATRPAGPARSRPLCAYPQIAKIQGPRQHRRRGKFRVSEPVRRTQSGDAFPPVRIQFGEPVP